MDKFPDTLTPAQCPADGVSKEKMRHLRHNITQHIRNNREKCYTLHLKEKYNKEELEKISEELTLLGWIVSFKSNRDGISQLRQSIIISRK